MYGKPATLFDQDIVPEEVKKSHADAKVLLKPDPNDENRVLESKMSSNYFNVGNDLPSLEDLLQIYDPGVDESSLLSNNNEEYIEKNNNKNNLEIQTENEYKVAEAINTTLSGNIYENSKLEILIENSQAESAELDDHVIKDISITTTDNVVGKKKIQTEELETEETPPAKIPEDWKGEKQYYSIGEVSELFKVKTSNIRFWTTEFKIKVRTTRKGDRLYTAAQVKELRMIYHLVKEKGFTLSGARAKMKEQNNRIMVTMDLKETLLQLKDKLLTIRNQLN